MTAFFSDGVFFRRYSFSATAFFHSRTDALLANRLTLLTGIRRQGGG
jgi:hypothetical protein